MNELKKYIAPSAQVSIFDRDIVTSSPLPVPSTGDGGVNLDEDLDIGI